MKDVNDQRIQAQDDLCTLAFGYLKVGQTHRALVLLLTGMSLGVPTQRLLLLCGRCFLDLGQGDQAQSVLERHDRLFGPTRLSHVMLRRADRLIQTAPPRLVLSTPTNISPNASRPTASGTP